jgi:hypothetical protein
MMSGEMARSTAHQSTFYAAFGFRRRRCCQDEENGGASNVFILASSRELVRYGGERRPRAKRCLYNSDH